MSSTCLFVGLALVCVGCNHDEGMRDASALVDGLSADPDGGLDGGSGVGCGVPPTGCVAPDVECGGRCVDLVHDAANCGACGHACGAGSPAQVCKMAACIQPVVAASCSPADVSAAGGLAGTNGVVSVPPGTCTWSSASTTYIGKGLTLQGSGVDQTIIKMSLAGPAYRAVLGMGEADITVTGFTFTYDVAGYTGTSPHSPYAISAGGDRFRITGNRFTNNSTDPKGVGQVTITVNGAYGLIDDNVFEGMAGGSETIFVRGPSDSWSTADSFGGADNVFIENNTFKAADKTSVKVTDCNANSRCVVRYNDLVNTYFDAHGRWSDTPAHSAREYEVYNNSHTVSPSDGSFEQQEYGTLRGGTGRIFNNDFTGMMASSSKPAFQLKEYCVFDNNGNCYPTSATPRYVCPSDYPALDQVGRGQQSSDGTEASDPLYFWHNRFNGQPAVVVSNGGPSAAARAACAIDAGYTGDDIIQLDRDYYVSDAIDPAVCPYTPYVCPHPLTGLTSHCSPSTAGKAGYAVP